MPPTENSRARPSVVALAEDPSLELLRVLPDVTTGKGRDWRNRALCAQTDPDIFFPGKGQSSAPAKQVCAGCGVRAECLQQALDRGERFGMWGGLPERERRALAACLARQPKRARYCPAHGGALSGGPVLYHCPAGRLGHGVAAGLDQAVEAREDAA